MKYVNILTRNKRDDRNIETLDHISGHYLILFNMIDNKNLIEEVVRIF